MSSKAPMVHAFWRRSAVVLLILAAVAPAPALAQIVEWSKEDVEALLRVVESADEEGLDPKDYAKHFLQEAVLRDLPPSSTLNDIALRLASDFRYGRVSGADRVDWKTETANPSLLAQIVMQAVAEDRVEEAFRRLLPAHEEYGALKKALADTTGAKRRTALRVNMERWRWMPRELGDKHLFINIPSYRVELVEDGAVMAEHAAIVGKPSTPTSAFSTTVTAVRFNPGWAVPPGLEAQKLSFYKRSPTAAKRMGYSVSYGPDGPSIWQRPGPGNALGQVRFVMPNPYLIYLHDTPEKGLFARNARALSQGCVRTQEPVELAARLLADDGTDQLTVDTALAEGSTQEIGLNAPVPVHIAYLTAEVDAGGAVKLLPDIYGRDARVARALDGGTQLASK